MFLARVKTQKAHGYFVFPGAKPAHDACFEDVNAAGNAFGNCGKDEHGVYKKCDKR